MRLQRTPAPNQSAYCGGFVAEEDRTKVCTKCGQRLSLDNFNKAGSAGRLRGDCRACQNAFDLARNAARRAADGPPPEFKTCAQCGEAKRFTKEFYKTRSRAKWGLATECRTCASKMEVARVHGSEHAKELKRENNRKHAVKRKKSAAKWQKENREKRRAYVSAWRQRNLEHHNRTSHEYYMARKDEICQRHAEWRANNKEAMAAYTRNYKARKLGATGTHSKADVLALFEVQRGKCAACSCKLKRYDVDHIEPLSKGGANDRKNLQLLCPTCNRRKAARHPVDFMRLMGKLL